MKDTDRAKEQGRLEEALGELCEAIPKTRRGRLFAAMALVECRAKHALQAFALLEETLEFLPATDDEEWRVHEEIRSLLRAAGWKIGE